MSQDILSLFLEWGVGDGVGWVGLKQRVDEVGWERAENVGVLHEKRVRATAGESAATEERYSFALQCGYSYV